MVIAVNSEQGLLNPLMGDARRPLSPARDTAEIDARRVGRVAFDHAHLALPSGKILLDDISLAIEPGSKRAVIGPNGAGKTSLLRLLFGQVVPTRGSVHIDGRPVHRIPPAERARLIAVVTQNSQPDPRLTIRRYVELGRIPHRGRVSAAVHRNAIDRAIDRVALTSLAARPLQHASGGERQRAAIARATVQEPAVLLLNEPTNHLDPRARADVLALAAQWDGTVVAILHDLDRITVFADHVAVLAAGRLVAHGATASALQPDIVRTVFDMDCFRVVHPITGRDHRRHRVRGADDPGSCARGRRRSPCRADRHLRPFRRHHVACGGLFVLATVLRWPRAS